MPCYVSEIDERESNYHLNARALAGIEKCQSLLTMCVETMQLDMEKRDFRRIKHGVMLRGARAAIYDTKSFIEKAKDSLPTRILAFKPPEIYIPPSHRHRLQLTRHRQPVHEVLKVTELTERILLNLDVKDLLHCQQVNQNMFGVIDGSSALQQKMLLLPAPSSLFTTFDTNETLSYNSQQSHGPMQEPYKLSKLRLDSLSEDAATKRATWHLGFFSNAFFSEETLGERVRSMLICQPPVYEMKVRMFCCTSARRTANGANIPIVPPTILKSQTGITVGQICEVTKTIRAEHRMCPFALAHMCDDEGYITVWPLVEATIQLEPDDPVVIQSIERIRHLNLLKSYCAARADGIYIKNVTPFSEPKS